MTLPIFDLEYPRDNTKREYVLSRFTVEDAEEAPEIIACWFNLIDNENH